MNLATTIQLKKGGLIRIGSTVSKLTSNQSVLLAAAAPSLPSHIAHRQYLSVLPTSMKKVIVPPVFPDDDIEPNSLSDHDELLARNRCSS